MSSACPSCGTHWEKGEEPWLQNKVHCAKHDFLHLVNVECDHCKSEREHEQVAEEQNG